MTLVKSQSCHSECEAANFKVVTAPGEAFSDTSSDRGSTPLASTKNFHLGFYITVHMGVIRLQYIKANNELKN